MAMMRLLLIGAMAAALPTAEFAASSQTTSSATTTTVADPEANKIICRKRAEVGSLVRKTKECFTKAEWEKITESQVRGTRRMHQELQGGMRCDPDFQPC
jgi:hypothetical protein